FARRPLPGREHGRPTKPMLRAPRAHKPIGCKCHRHRAETARAAPKAHGEPIGTCVKRDRARCPLDRCDDAPPAPGAVRSAPWSCTPPAVSRCSEQAPCRRDLVTLTTSEANIWFRKLAAAMGAQWAIVVGEVVSRTVFCPGHSHSAHQGQL